MMRHLSTVLLTFILLLVPTMIFAAEAGYINLIGGQTLVPNENTGSIQGIVTIALRAAIVAAALLAVFKLMIAGGKYALSPVVSDVSEAKKDIQGALLGLLIVILAVTILTTINSQLTQLSGLQQITYSLPTIPTDKRALTDRVTTCPEGESLVVSSVDNKKTESCISIAERDTRVLLTETNQTFSYLPLDPRTLTDAQERTVQLRDLTAGDILGYLVLDPNTPEGQAILKNYDNNIERVEEELMKVQCEKQGGTRLITIPRTRINGSAFYCIKKN